MSNKGTIKKSANQSAEQGKKNQKPKPNNWRKMKNNPRKNKNRIRNVRARGYVRNKKYVEREIHYVQNLEMHTRQTYSFGLTEREPEA